MLPTRWKKTHFEVSPDMAEYIKQSTNKSLEKYKQDKINTNKVIRIKEEEKNIFILAFVSIFSFCMGYKFKQLTN